MIWFLKKIISGNGSFLNGNSFVSVEIIFFRSIFDKKIPKKKNTRWWRSLPSHFSLGGNPRTNESQTLRPWSRRKHTSWQCLSWSWHTKHGLLSLGAKLPNRADIFSFEVQWARDHWGQLLCNVRIELHSRIQHFLALQNSEVAQELLWNLCQKGKWATPGWAITFLMIPVGTQWVSWGQFFE
jgi:hypothetical protein